ncbi:Mur ligase family protein [Candidatus Bipolaricaulota sp. J31]
MNWPYPCHTVAILGLGRTGRALIEVLSPLGLSLFLSEKRKLSSSEREFLSRHGVRWEEGGHSEAVLGCELIVPSPGVPPHEPVLREAVRRGIPVVSEIEVAWRMGRPRCVIAVTGTNGKSTVTALIGRILGAAGKDPVVAGNIGTPAIATVREAANRPWVLEISSAQLEWTEEFHPHVAVFLNFAPDHLDHHGSLGAYFAAKARIFRNQAMKDVAVLPRELLSRISPRARVILYEGERLPPGWGTGLPEHLALDLRAAWAAARAAFPGLTPPPYAEVEAALRQPHRLEYVGEIEGIPFIDDSKATNAHATAAALRAVPAKCVLLLGGRQKGGGYEALRPLLAEKVRMCVLFGESRAFFAGLLSRWGIPFREESSPEGCLEVAYRAARPGDWVLLSPACASFDQFENYAHRGAVFREAFRALSQRSGRMSHP